MAIIFTELDPVFETMGLIYSSYHLDELKDDTIKSLSDFGYDGEQFYSRYLKVYDKYIQLFRKKRIENPEDSFFFGDADTEYFQILLSLMVTNPEWLEPGSQISGSTINQQIICTVLDEPQPEPGTNPENLEYIISILARSELNETTKWKTLCIMQEPVKYIKQLILCINSNLSACQETVAGIQKPLAKLLSQYDTLISNQEDRSFHEIQDQFSQNADIYPTMVFPLSQIIYEKKCYYGVLSQTLTKTKKNQALSKEVLLLRLKALSDSSKLEIISSLKISPKYNLEIAQQLGLSAATMSHHMNVLLSCGFVGIEKKDGKVYYHLKKENLEEILEELKQVLL